MEKLTGRSSILESEAEGDGEEGRSLGLGQLILD
jgi:hypothetical protein